MNYNELSQTAHAAAKANGWYDTIEPINTYLALIKSEAYKALDAFRSNKYAITKSWAKSIDLSESDYEAFAADFKLEIKDTFQDEIADTAIRILDFCGWYEIELKPVVKIQTKEKGKFASDLVALDKLIGALYDNTGKHLFSVALTGILGMLESIAEVYEFDLEQHIALKIAYNKTRGYKHGNKVL